MHIKHILKSKKTAQVLIAIASLLLIISSLAPLFIQR